MPFWFDLYLRDCSSRISGTHGEADRAEAGRRGAQGDAFEEVDLSCVVVAVDRSRRHRRRAAALLLGLARAGGVLGRGSRHDARRGIAMRRGSFTRTLATVRARAWAQQLLCFMDVSSKLCSDGPDLIRKGL